MAGAGLEDMVAGQTSISTIDGKRGVLTYRGISIHEMADHSSFEETVFLLWYGRLPKADELVAFKSAIGRESILEPKVAAWLKTLPGDANPMSLLRTGVSLLGLADPEEGASVSPEAYKEGQKYMGQLTPGAPGFGPEHPASRKAIRTLGRMTCLVAAIQRIMKKQDFVEANPSKGVAFNFLRCLNGVDPDAANEAIFDKCLILHADHEFNASTFTARVACATLSDLHSCVVAAIGALKGPLHGGANTEVMHMLLEIGTPDKATAWVKDALEKKKKIMGFGHRMYKTEDPRATHLRRMSESLCAKVGRPELYEMSKLVEEAMWDLKAIKPNVDFYSASVYLCMGIDPEMFTPIFALSRLSGWTAHIYEQQSNNRLMRPVGEWVGANEAHWVEMDQR
jgi:citrate synthase